MREKLFDDLNSQSSYLIRILINSCCALAIFPPWQGWFVPYNFRVMCIIFSLSGPCWYLFMQCVNQLKSNILQTIEWHFVEQQENYSASNEGGKEVENKDAGQKFIFSGSVIVEMKGSSVDTLGTLPFSQQILVESNCFALLQISTQPIPSLDKRLGLSLGVNNQCRTLLNFNKMDK